MTSSGMPKALAGIKVLEIASYITGPYAGMLLADMGAEVIKVEEPEKGDEFRKWSGHGYGPVFAAFNRNKRSVALDLRSPAGQEVAFQMARQVDVLIENFRPGVLDRRGLGYEAVRAANSGIVYCSITGFGREGPYRDRPGFDTAGQALGGLLSVLTDIDRPQPLGIALADDLTAIYACYGILTALLARARTGCGQRVETSLLQASVSLVGEVATHFFRFGKVPLRKTRVSWAQVHALVAADGRPLVIHLSSPDKFWGNLADAIGRPELRDDPRFATGSDREKHYDEIHAILTEVFRGRTRDEWLRELEARNVPCAPLNTLDEVFDDPQVRHSQLEVALTHPTMGTWRVTANPARLSETPAGYYLAPPMLGEHTAAVLGEFGLSSEQIAALQSAGVAGGGDDTNRVP